MRMITSVRLTLGVALAMIAVAVSAILPSAARAAAQGNVACTPEWNLSFEDHFEGNQVNTSAWNIYDSPGHANNGLRRPRAMSVGNGLLTITAQDEDGQVVSGGMDSRASWTYGRFEARVRTDLDPSQTMSGVVIAWPEQQDFENGNYRELNLYETGYEVRNPLGFWVHYAIPNNPDRPRFFADVDATQWHDVRMDWTDTKVAFWVDGTFVGETTRPETIPHREMSMTLQLDAFRQALGSDDTVEMDVDWVRVWSWNPAGTEECKADVPGADEPVQVAHTTTCLAGNGRVDTNIVNLGATPATYRIEFAGLSPRQTTVDPGDWWRMPITGRADGSYEVVVLRDGVRVNRENVLIGCDGEAKLVTNDEIQIVNACRADRGYVLFQFANPTDAQRSWIIEFEDVPNRSTSAGPGAGAVRAVTGRPAGTYDVRVRSGDDVIATFDITVDCTTESRLRQVDVSATFENGSAAPGVKVDLYRSDGTNRLPGGFIESVLTDGQGGYSWSVEDGCWAVVLQSLDGTSFEPGNPNARFDEQHACTDGGNVSFQSVLYRQQNTRGINVTAIWEDDSPAVGVEVDLFERNEMGTRGPFIEQVLTDGAGIAAFAAPDGCYVVVVSAPDDTSFDPGDPESRYDERQGCTAGADLAFDTQLYRLDNVRVFAGEVEFAGQGPAAAVQVDHFVSVGGGQRGEFLGSQFTGDDGAFSFTMLDGCYAIVAVAPTGWSFTEGASEMYEELHRCTDGASITLAEPLTLYPAPVVA